MGGELGICLSGLRKEGLHWCKHVSWSPSIPSCSEFKTRRCELWRWTVSGGRHKTNLGRESISTRVRSYAKTTRKVQVWSIWICLHRGIRNRILRSRSGQRFSACDPSFVRASLSYSTRTGAMERCVYFATPSNFGPHKIWSIEVGVGGNKNCFSEWEHHRETESVLHPLGGGNWWFARKIWERKKGTGVALLS